jgi:hypothetical protein
MIADKSNILQISKRPERTSARKNRLSLFCGITQNGVLKDALFG